MLWDKKDKMEEECGIFAIYSNDTREDLATLGYYGLLSLQHRGQESAGISIANNNTVNTIKGMGLVTNVFSANDLSSYSGNILIGHVRYSTMGASNLENAQPLEASYDAKKIVIAHNGNLVNIDVIKELLIDLGVEFTSTSDSEVILKLISRKIDKGYAEAIKDAIRTVKGAFALVIIIDNKLIGIRDPHGIRPLCLGQLQDGSYVMASESCALDTIGATLIRDIEAGEAVIIDENGLTAFKYAEEAYKAPCSFEHIYFARPDSVMDNIEVYSARYRAGKLIAQEVNIDADIVIGVPDSGIPAAIGFSEESNIPYSSGLIKNKYITRTFIKPTQKLREEAVQAKLNPIKKHINNKRVVIVDDSIVRGTTSKKLVDILRRGGAKEVHFISASPAVKFPCHFGIDTSTREELIASDKSIEEIKKYIGADSLHYLSLDNLFKALKHDGFCAGCFHGTYPISNIT